MYQDGPKCPQIENLTKITPEQAAEYVRLEKELDALNAHLLDPTPKKD